MDYAIEIQRILDALKADQEPNKYWKNKVIGRLTELQPFCLMFYETPSFSDPMPAAPIDGVSEPSVPQIPPALQEFADPSRLQTPQPPQQPNV